MIIPSHDFQVPEGTTVDLNKWPTAVKALYPHGLNRGSQGGRSPVDSL